MSKRSFSSDAAAIGALAIVLLVCLAPAAQLIRDATSAFAAGHGALLLEARHGELLLRSVLVASVATSLALVWGIPTGLVLSRLRGLPGAAMQGCAILPLFIPSMVTVIGWIHLLGRKGPIAWLFERLFGLDAPPFDIYGPAGAGFVLSLVYFPCVSLSCAQGFRAMPQSALLAAELSSSRASQIRGVVIPLLSPYALLGACLVFLLAFSDFAVPSALMVNVYPVDIHAQFSASLEDGPRRAALLCLPPLVLAVGLSCGWRLAARRLSGRTEPARTLGERGRSDARRCPRSALMLALLALALSVVVPLVFLAITAGPPSAYARAARTAGTQVLNSLIVAAWTAPVLLVLGAAYAVAWERLPAAARAWAEALVLLPLVIPGAAVGLGIVSLHTSGVPPWSWLYPHAAILACASASRFLPFPALILAQAWVSLRAGIREAGEVSGAGTWSILGRLILPLLLPGALAAMGLSFALALGEIAAAVLVAPPGMMTLPVRLASLLHFGEEPTVAALCVMISGFAIGLLCLLQLLANQLLRLELHRGEPGR